MNIHVSGVNYRSTPLEVREMLSFNPDEQKKLLDRVSWLPGIMECVLLSTCNRTEIYIHSNSDVYNNTEIERALCEIKGISLYEHKKYFYTYSKLKAVKHLFKVCCGLDSMVLGEDQILGQVKSAYDMSLEMGVSANVLNTLFRNAITAAKKVKTNTQLSRNSVSIGSLSVKLISDIYGGRLEDKSFFVIGAGKIGCIALKNLCEKGAGRIYVANRSHGKSQDLSKIYSSVCPIEYQDRYKIIDECDVVISSTSSPHYTITRDMLDKSVRDSKERVFIDLAVPRDIDESISSMPGVKYYNIDHLKTVADENLDKRIIEASKAEQIIDEYIDEYEKWYTFKSVMPVVKELQKHVENVVNEKLISTVEGLKSTSDEDKEAVRVSINSALNEIMDTFVYSVRKNGTKEDIKAYFRCLEDAIKEN